MTLLITVFAAVAATALWYGSDSRHQMKWGTLCWLFWGASLLWLVDAIFEYRELGASYFTPDLESLVNDAFLGLSVVALALVIWIVNLLITDPKHVVRNELIHKS